MLFFDETSSQENGSDSTFLSSNVDFTDASSASMPSQESLDDVVEASFVFSDGGARFISFIFERFCILYFKM